MRDEPALLSNAVLEYLEETVRQSRQQGDDEFVEKIEFWLHLVRTFRRFGIDEGFLELLAGSLAAGLLVGGCRSVVASAWQVPDAATAELMGGMYRRWREDGVGLPEALRGAQLEAMDHRPPYAWAGFSYSGA